MIELISLKTKKTTIILVTRIILYIIAFTSVLIRLLDGINQFGAVRGILRTIFLDCFVWVVILGWFGFIPGIPPFKLLTSKK